MPHPNVELLKGFYEAFGRGDGSAMAGVYAEDAVFSDPVFTELRGKEVGGMWRMLTSRAKDLVVTYRDVEADDRAGKTHWEAQYTFRTGRRVHNIIEASFELKEGRVVRHIDRFDFWRWSRMALGPAGLLLGWSPILQNKVRAEAHKGLEAFLSRP